MIFIKNYFTNKNTLASQLEKYKNIGPGFDFLRLALAICIMAIHSLPLAQGISFFHHLSKELLGFILCLLPMFFGLSGFLVTGSALRIQNAFRFAWHRILRIIPALTVEVFLSAILLGALVSTLSFQDYFLSRGFWIYFGNIIGFIQFELPGVFLNNPYKGTVNGNLWTITPEYYCYLIFIGLMAFKIFSQKRLYLISLYLLFITFFILDFLYHIGESSFTPSSSNLILSFLFGSILFLKADKIPFRLDLCILCILIYVFFWQSKGFTYLSSLPLVYVVIYLGMFKLWIPSFLRSGDYSYGIYLYGFPIQQTLVFTFKEMQSPFILFISSLTLTMFVAYFSWHFVEKHCLKLKRITFKKSK